MAKSQNDLVAAAQTLARLQQRRKNIFDQAQKKLAAIDTDIASVKTFIQNATADVETVTE